MSELNRATVVFDWSQQRVEVNFSALDTLTPAQRRVLERIAARLQRDIEHELFGLPPVKRKDNVVHLPPGLHAWRL
jgi:hypothetical protein